MFFLHLIAIIFMTAKRPKWVGMINQFPLSFLGGVEKYGEFFLLTSESLTLASDSLCDTSGLLPETGEFNDKAKDLLRSNGEVIRERTPQTIMAT